MPALLKRKFGIDEVTTLLLNPVALLVVQGLLNGPWRNSESGFTDSDRLGSGYDLPALFPDSRVHWGFGLAVVVIVVSGVVLSRTATGVRISAAGQAPKAAEFSGIAVGRLQFRCALVSGAVAGLGGASQVMGVQHQLTSGISNNYGYTGVIVATLGDSARSACSWSRSCSATSRWAPRTSRSCSRFRPSWARCSARCCCFGALGDELAALPRPVAEAPAPCPGT